VITGGIGANSCRHGEDWSAEGQGSVSSSEQKRAMVYGKRGKYGIVSNVESVSYRQLRASVGSNPTLSATVSG